jgi:hypothetical protein
LFAIGPDDEGEEEEDDAGAAGEGVTDSFGFARFSGCTPICRASGWAGTVEFEAGEEFKAGAEEEELFDDLKRRYAGTSRSKSKRTVAAIRNSNPLDLGVSPCTATAISAGASSSGSTNSGSAGCAAAKTGASISAMLFNPSTWLVSNA